MLLCVLCCLLARVSTWGLNTIDIAATSSLLLYFVRWLCDLLHCCCCFLVGFYAGKSTQRSPKTASTATATHTFNIRIHFNYECQRIDAKHATWNNNPTKLIARAINGMYDFELFAFFLLLLHLHCALCSLLLSIFCCCFFLKFNFGHISSGLIFMFTFVSYSNVSGQLYRIVVVLIGFCTRLVSTVCNLNRASTDHTADNVNTSMGNIFGTLWIRNWVDTTDTTGDILKILITNQPAILKEKAICSPWLWFFGVGWIHPSLPSPLRPSLFHSSFLLPFFGILSLLFSASFLLTAVFLYIFCCFSSFRHFNTLHFNSSPAQCLALRRPFLPLLVHMQSTQFLILNIYLNWFF